MTLLTVNDHLKIICNPDAESQWGNSEMEILKQQTFSEEDFQILLSTIKMTSEHCGEIFQVAIHIAIHSKNSPDKLSQCIMFFKDSEMLAIDELYWIDKSILKRIDGNAAKIIRARMKSISIADRLLYIRGYMRLRNIFRDAK